MLSRKKIFTNLNKHKMSQRTQLSASTDRQLNSNHHKVSKVLTRAMATIRKLIWVSHTPNHKNNSQSSRSKSPSKYTSH